MGVVSDINNKAIELLNERPEGIRWSELLRLLQAVNKNWHPKTVNGCVWQLVNKYPDQVYKPEKGLFRLTKYQSLQG